MISQNNFFLDQEKIRTVDTFKIIYFVGFLFALGFTVIGRYVYRPFIYANQLNDIGIATLREIWAE